MTISLEHRGYRVVEVDSMENLLYVELVKQSGELLESPPSYSVCHCLCEGGGSSS